MELIVGGRSQGKRECAIRHLQEKHISHWEMIAAVEWAQSEQSGNASTAIIVYDLQELAKKMCDEAALWRFVETVCQSYEEVIFVCDEVGCGVVPMEKEERAWRDRTGHLCVKLVQRADRVTRMLCGLEQTIFSKAVE